MAEFYNALQFGQTPVQWDPTKQIWSGAPETMPGYVPMLLQTRERVRSGQATPGELAQYQQWEAQARAMPTRDIASLTAGWQGDLQGQWTDSGWQAGNADWWTALDPGSPDVGGIMLQLADKLDAGTATPQERTLYDQVRGMGEDWNYRASVPQASDAFSPLGDQFFQALTALTTAVGGAGAFGGFGAAAAGAGAGASAAAASPTLLGIPTSTLSTLGAIGSYGGMGANVLGAATDQDWLRQLGLGLGVAGGLAGGLAGLGNVLNTGVQNLSDAARLASSTGRIVGAAGRASGAEPLQQAARYLGMAGQLGNVGSGVLPTSVTDWSTQRGGAMDFNLFGDDFLNYSGGGQGMLLSDVAPGIDWGSFTAGGPGSWAGQVLTDFANGPFDTGGRGVSALSSVLGSVGSFLGRNAGLLGPAASALGSLGAGVIGSNAASDAAALQSQYLNRGLDLQTAQWLQQQERTAPWVQAGQDALGHMVGRSTWDQPTLGQLGPLSPAAYNQALPSPTPGWQPSTYAGYTPTDMPSAAQYRYTPGSVPSAAQYRYTPGATPDAAAYRYTPGAVPTLSGRELLANDPGYQFRQDEARRALEASAAARGGLTSGATLSALQRQSQDLASQEYGNAWNRASQQAQLREQWARDASQLGFGQAMDAARFREQAAQVASQQGWTQAEAETRLREQMSQVASQQNWGQALQEADLRRQQAQFAWNAGFQGQQQGQREAQAYDTDLYNRQWQTNELQFRRDAAEREAQYQRMVDQYNAQRQGQNTAFNQFASLANLGQTTIGNLGTLGSTYGQQAGSLLGQIGTAQGLGQMGPANAWGQALGGLTGNLNNYFGQQNAMNILASLNR